MCPLLLCCFVYFSGTEKSKDGSRISEGDESNADTSDTGDESGAAGEVVKHENCCVLLFKGSFMGDLFFDPVQVIDSKDHFQR